MYEDDVAYKEAFYYSLNDKFKRNGHSLIINHKENSNEIEQDLFTCNPYPDLIMIDHDLGKTTGDEIINIIEGWSDYRKVRIFYYSGGESLDELERRAAKHKCIIKCFTKDGDELNNAILGLIINTKTKW